MDPTPQQNPLAGLMALMGPNTAASASAPPQSQVLPQSAAVPSGGGGSMQPPSAPPQQNTMPQMIQGMMGQAQGAMNAPMGQPVPPANPIVDALKHPVVAGLLKALATAAQSYGWTAMQPSERLERTQMQQQKGEALSRLAETGAYQEGMLGIRGQQLGINQQKADTGEERAQTAAAAQGSLADFRSFEKQNMQDKLALATDANNWKQQMAQGRLDKAQQMIDQRATQFEQKIALAQKQFGLEETKTSLMGEGLGIKQGMLDLARTALSQKGTVEGAQAMSKIQQFKIEHPIMSQFMDMSDLDQLTGAAGGAGLPGVAPMSPTPAPATTTGTPAPTTKAEAKKKQSAPSGGGGTHYYFDAQGNQVAGQ